MTVCPLGEPPEWLFGGMALVGLYTFLVFPLADWLARRTRLSHIVIVAGPALALSIALLVFTVLWGFGIVCSIP